MKLFGKLDSVYVSTGYAVRDRWFSESLMNSTPSLKDARLK
jgi:hypothetical protein